MIFDNKLSFIPHLKSLRAKCLKAMDILKVVGHKDWGADSETLLKLYRSLIRSKLDYGCVVYGSARTTYTQMLDPIQNQALRICLGAFRTSPVESLQAEANETPLRWRRQKLSVQFALKLYAHPDNPTFECTFSPNYKNLFENKPNMIPTFGIRVERLLQEISLDLSQIGDSNIVEHPPWTLHSPQILFSLHSIPKSELSSIIVKQQFYELRSHYSEYECIYTDGSKTGNQVT